VQQQDEISKQNIFSYMNKKK